MNTLDIIKSSMTREGITGQKQQQALGALTLILRTGKAKLVQLGNSVFMITVTAPGQVEVHLFSEEQGGGLVDNLRKLANYLRQIGVKKATTVVDDPRYVSLVKASGLPINVSQTVDATGGQAKPAYKLSMEF